MLENSRSSARRQRCRPDGRFALSRALSTLLLTVLVLSLLLAGPSPASAGRLALMGTQWGPAVADAPTAATLQALETAAVPTGYSSKLRRYPYLTDLVDQYVTINWATDTSGLQGSATWGRVGAESCTAHTVPATKKSIDVNGITEFQWKAKLTLTAGAQYCYRIFLNATDLLNTNASPQFWTQVPAGSTEPFTFAVIGETGFVDATGTNPAQARLMSLLAASGARFVLSPGEVGHTSGSQTNFGDLVQTGLNTSGFFGPQFWAKVGASTAFFPEIGNLGMARSDINHPHLTNFPQDRAVSLSNGRYITETYSGLDGTTPADYPSTWYAFNAGNARFYMLQAAWPNGNVGTGDIYKDDYDYHWSGVQWSPTQKEYDWLLNDLTSHASQLKFAVFQFPIYSDNDNQPSDTYLHGATRLEGVLSSHGVVMAFSAQSQNYQRWLEPSGGLYTYVTGGGGAPPGPLRLCSTNDAYGIGWSDLISVGYGCHTPDPTSRDKVLHILIVHVNGSVVTVTPINSLGETFDPQVYNFPGGLVKFNRSLYLPAMFK